MNTIRLRSESAQRQYTAAGRLKLLFDARVLGMRHDQRRFSGDVGIRFKYQFHSFPSYMLYTKAFVWLFCSSRWQVCLTDQA